MSDTEEIVTLAVGGKRLKGFQEVNITRSTENATISFALKATNPAWSDDAWALKVGAEVELTANGTLVAKGYIDEYESTEGEGDSKEVSISGRSKSQDFVDCPPAKHKTGRIENKTLVDAAKEFDEFGVGIKTDVADLRPIPKIQRGPEETAFQTIERYAKAEGVMLVGEPDGSINITRVGQKRHAGVIEHGKKPILRISVKYSAKDKKSPVITKSQSDLGVEDSALRREQKVYDDTVGRYRPAIRFLEREGGDRDVKRRGEWKRLRQHGSGTQVNLSLAGWRDKGGTLWTPGHLVAVSWPAERLDQDLSVSTVTFTQNDKGTIAALTLVEPKSQGGSASSGGGKKGGKAAGKAGNDAFALRGDIRTV